MVPRLGSQNDATYLSLGKGSMKTSETFTSRIKSLSIFCTGRFEYDPVYALLGLRLEMKRDEIFVVFLVRCVNGCCDV